MRHVRIAATLMAYFEHQLAKQLPNHWTLVTTSSCYRPETPSQTLETPSLAGLNPQAFVLVLTPHIMHHVVFLDCQYTSTCQTDQRQPLRTESYVCCTHS